MFPTMAADPDPDPPGGALLGGPAGQGPAPVPPPRGMRHAVRAFRHRDFAIFWTGALASNTGSWVQNLTVPYVLYQITESAFWVGAATFAQFIPAMALGPLAGSLADRFDRRHILMVTQSLMAVAALALWAAWAAELHQLGVILGLVTVSGVIAGINIPSWQTFVNDMVPREDLLSAVTLNSLQFNAARAFGPAIAGLVLEALGPSWAFFLNAASFGFVLVALLLVRVRVGPRATPLSGNVRAQFGRALRYVQTQPGIVIGILVAVVVGALGNPIQQFTVVFAEDVFEVDALHLGLLNVGLGLGAVTAAPVVSGWDQVVSRSTLVRIGLPAYGTAIVAFALAPTFWVAAACLVVVGAGFLVVISVTNTAVQIIVADRVRGRVLALRIMAFTGAYPVGALIQGTIADVVGPRPTVAGAGVVLVGLGVYLSVVRPGLLARLDDPHDDSPSPSAATPAPA